MSCAKTVEFTFRGLSIEAAISPSRDATRETPPEPAFCEDWSFAEIDGDGSDLICWLADIDEMEQYEAQIENGELPTLVLRWIEENWSDEICEAANEYKDDE